MICSPRSGRGNDDCFSDEREEGEEIGVKIDCMIYRSVVLDHMFWYIRIDMNCSVSLSNSRGWRGMKLIEFSEVAEESRLRSFFEYFIADAILSARKDLVQRMNRVDRLRVYIYILVMKFCFQRNRVNI